VFRSQCALGQQMSRDGSVRDGDGVRTVQSAFVGPRAIAHVRLRCRSLTGHGERTRLAADVLMAARGARTLCGNAQRVQMKIVSLMIFTSPLGVKRTTDNQSRLIESILPDRTIQLS
jgi:hypothetical protein